MKYACRVLSTYTADVSGVCSALFELGGMTVMHDASGCNSTYNTHDEPRWYDMVSLVFISALTEMEAVLGGDKKLINDVTEAAAELEPAFIAVAGTPIPMMMGTDFTGVAAEIEEKTGIITFGIDTNGTRSYIEGISKAFCALAERVCTDGCEPDAEGNRVNLLGVTPLDFSVTGSAEALREEFAAHGYKVNSCWSMGSSLDDIKRAGCANVNCVVSASGLAAARVLRRRFGTPYIVGVPFGREFAKEYFDMLKETVRTGESRTAYRQEKQTEHPVMIIGEAVAVSSLCAALALEGIDGVTAVCPLEPDAEIFFGTSAWSEEDLRESAKNARCVIADPLFGRILRPEVPLIRLPHEAYSGRTYRSEIPVLIGDRLGSLIADINRQK